MQLEHEHQPPDSTVPACSPTQPIPALAAGPQPLRLSQPQLLEGPSTPGGGREWCCGPLTVGPQLPSAPCCSSVECRASLTCPLCPPFLSWARPRPGLYEKGTGTLGPHSPLLLVGQHGLRDGQLVREAGSSDELGNTACYVHSVCGHKEPWRPRWQLGSPSGPCCCQPAPLLTCWGRLSPAEQLPPRRVQEQSAVLVIHRGQVLGQRVGACRGTRAVLASGRGARGGERTALGLLVALTQWYKQEAKVVEPVGGLAGQLLHKETEDNTQVALVPCHHHLHWGRHMGVTVTAAKGKGDHE